MFLIPVHDCIVWVCVPFTVSVQCKYVHVPVFTLKVIRHSKQGNNGPSNIEAAPCL